ncbi:MAG TPA: hypothetical protein VF155_10340 [Candidatus Dormibacteraeota bacterium]
MRIPTLESGHSARQKALFRVARRLTGGVAPPILVLSYRRDHFGRWLAPCFQEAMRKATEWSTFETELFAAFVSTLNRTRYCMVDHTAVAVAASGDASRVDQILSDYRSAPIDERLRATLAFLEKLVLDPGDMTPADAECARRAGASSRALREAAYVAFDFSVMDRLADGFGFEVETGGALRWTARILHRLGYGMASVPG